jgi:hypothetical protein
VAARGLRSPARDALYLLLLAFGFGGALVSVVLIRTAQRVTVSLPGFLETGSQQAMIVAILSQGTMSR